MYRGLYKPAWVVQPLVRIELSVAGGEGKPQLHALGTRAVKHLSVKEVRWGPASLNYGFLPRHYNRSMCTVIHTGFYYTEKGKYYWRKVHYADGL